MGDMIPIPHFLPGEGGNETGDTDLGYMSPIREEDPR